MKMMMKMVRMVPWLGAVLVTLFATTAVDGASAADIEDDMFSERWLTSQCVRACNCTRLGQGRIKHLLVECTGMSTFIEYLPPGTTDLSLTGNSVKKITADDLKNIAKGLKRVRNFEFSRGILKELPVLHGFPHLRSMDLSFNQLGDITPEIFVYLKRLETLNLIGNPGLDCARFKKELERVITSCDDNPVSVITKASTFESEGGLQETTTFDLARTMEDPSGHAPVFRETVENTTQALNSTSEGGFQVTTLRNLDQTSAGKSSAVQDLVGWMGRASYGIYFLFFFTCFYV